MAAGSNPHKEVSARTENGAGFARKRRLASRSQPTFVYWSPTGSKGTAVARDLRTAVPSARRDPNEKLTLAEVCAELRIERSTFYDWRAKGRAPRCSKLPNGELRIVRRDLDAWYEGCRVI